MFIYYRIFVKEMNECEDVNECDFLASSELKDTAAGSIAPEDSVPKVAPDLSPGLGKFLMLGVFGFSALVLVIIYADAQKFLHRQGRVFK